MKQQKEKWEKEFDKKYPLDREIWVLQRHRKEIKSFICSLLEQERKRLVEEVKDRLVGAIMVDDILNSLTQKENQKCQK